jgi:uncharacterized membrane protein YeaQ/YmgE (transglycosylase-associated protein family)
MNWDLVWTVLYGAICGYVASRILGGEGFGFIGNIVVGILGSILGKWLVGQFSIPMPSGAVGNLVSSVGGAVVLLLILEVFNKMGASKTSRRRRS